MAARLTRGKRKIVTAGIPYAVPDAADLPARLDGVAQTAYLAFTAGYAPGSGPDLRARRAGRRGRAARAGHPRPVPRRAGAAGPARAAAAPALAPRRPGRRRRAARPAARPGPLAVAPRRGRRGARRSSTRMPARRHLRARRELPAPGARGGRARNGGNGIRHPVGPSSASTTPTLVALNPSPAVRLAAAVALAERDGPRAGPGRPRRASTRRCRTATGCRRCAVSCSPGPVTTPRPSRPSTSRSPAARTTSSATTSPAAATSWRHRSRVDEHAAAGTRPHGVFLLVDRGSAAGRRAAPAGAAARRHRSTSSGHHQCTPSTPTMPRPAMNPSPPQASTVTSTGSQAGGGGESSRRGVSNRPSSATRPSVTAGEDEPPQRPREPPRRGSAARRRRPDAAERGARRRSPTPSP